jgi:hypothetical protein
MTGAGRRHIDFFVSRAGADAAVAAEIGRVLEDAGHRICLQQWDFANRNFMNEMHEALASGARVVALLSNEYEASDHCRAEWTNAIAADPLNRQGRLIVFRVGECKPAGLLTALSYWDLVPVRGNRELVRDIVLAAIVPGRHKPAHPLAATYWRGPRPIVHREIRETSGFSGRETELAAIEAALAAGAAAAVTQPAAVHGLGGIGKSVLAREYARRHPDRYAGVWWLNAERDRLGQGFEGIETGLVELGALFIRDLDRVEDRAKAARHALDFLADGGFDKPWLLIYDNADDLGVLRQWAPKGNAQVLLTTRLRGWPGGVRAIEIEEWPLPDAIAYLLQESGRADLGEAEADAIAQALGRLPLALSHAAAYLRRRLNVTAAAYVAGLARRMREAPPDAEYGRAVFATFGQALDEAEREAPAARAVLSLAAFLAPADIPEELLSQASPANPVAAADPEAIVEAIGALAHLSLIEFDPDRRAVSVHRLVQAAARDALGDTAPQWSDAALKSLFRAFPEPEPQTWPQCERLVAHVRAVADQITEDSRELAWLLGAAADYLLGRAALSEVLPLRRRCLAIAERLAAADPGNAGWQRDLSVSHNKVGDVLRAQGDLAAALVRYRAGLAIRQRLAAADPGNAGWQHDVALSLQRLGLVAAQTGDAAEALAQWRRGLAIMEKLVALAPDHAGFRRDRDWFRARIADQGG